MAAVTGAADVLVLVSSAEPSPLSAGVLDALDALPAGTVSVVLGRGGPELPRWERGRQVVVLGDQPRWSPHAVRERLEARAGRVDALIERRRQRLVPDRGTVLVVGALAFPLCGYAAADAGVTLLAGPDDFSFAHPTLLAPDQRALMAQRVSRYLVTTSATAGRMIRQFGLPHDRISSWWEPQALPAALDGHQLDVPDGVPVVASYGPLTWESGPDLFLRAAWDLRRSGTDAWFVWAGDVVDDQEQWKLDFEVEHLGLGDRFRLVPASSQAVAVDRASVVAITRRDDPDERAYLPAGAAGRPIVAMRSRVADHWGPDPVAGFVGAGAGRVVPFPDTVALAEALARLLAEPAAATQAGDAARARFIERHDPARSAAALLSHLSDTGDLPR